jgi:Na+-transporting methylmalonyl-CoA/oxaloacetate decarboxylase gamma subunit
VALITVVSGGLGISLGIAGGLVANGVGAHDGPIVIAVCGSTIVLAVSLILLALLWRVIGAATASQQNPIQGRQSELMNAVPEPVQIPAHNAASVTEHTTRTFEPPKYSESGRH